MATARDLREMDVAELLTRYSEAKEELFNLRFQHATGQLDNSARLGQVKRDIARIATVVRQREIEAAEADIPVDDNEPAGGNTDQEES